MTKAFSSKVASGKLCDVLTVSQTKSALGEFTDTETVRLSDQKCGFRELSGDEVTKYGSYANSKLARFYFNNSPAITTKDKIRYNSQIYNVINVYEVAGKASLLHVDTELQIQPGAINAA